MGLFKTAMMVCFALLPALLQADESCTDCHPKLDGAYRHEAAVMDCQLCHAPHERSTGRRDRLLKATNDLCFDCHRGNPLLEGCFPVYGDPRCGHPVNKHPVGGPRDPLYPDREFTCVSCHNPHSTDRPALFRYDYGKKTPYQGLDCAVCHWSKIIGPPAPPTPPWNTE